MSEIPLDTQIYCLDGECGKSSHVIIEQNSQKVTHLVVNYSNLLESHKYLVPIEYVIKSSSESIELSCTKKELALLPPFTEKRFFNPTTSKYEPLQNFGAEATTIFDSSAYLMWSDVSLSGDILSTPIESELIPPGNIAVHRGASIEATDGHIGRVEKFVIDPDEQQITRLVLQEGHVWDKKEISLPISAIASMDEEYIYLNIDKETVKSLP